MGKKIKEIFKITLIMCICTIGITGCSSEDKVIESINAYKEAWVQHDFEAMYDMLSSKSKEYTSKEEFIKRYTNIYTGLGINSIKIEPIKEEESDLIDIPFSVSMNTIAGDLKFNDYKVTLVKEEGNYKIEWNESLIFPKMIKNDKVRYENRYAVRGNIYDRNDKLLASNGVVKSIGIYPKVFEENKEENIKQMANILDISESYIEDKLNKNSNQEFLVHIVKVSLNEKQKISKLENMINNGVRINEVNSRVYATGEAFGNLLGYIAPITKEEMTQNEGKGYSVNSYIGRNGLEYVYEDKLRGKDGAYIYIERGDQKITIADTKPVNGEDIKLSIDSDLQNKIYSEMNKEKGSSTAIDPKTGEVLAMVSSPSYDSNDLVTYKTKTLDKIWTESERAEFINRTSNTYSPGSTFKLVTAAIGLESNIIKPEEAMDIKGLTWQKDSSWGDYEITRVKDTKGPVNFKDAVKYSDNIYFADKAIKVGSDEFINKAKNFGIGEKLEFEYPKQQSKISNSKELKTEVMLADTGYGQGEVMMSTLDVALAYSALSNEGNIMQPRLVVSENSEAKIYKNAIDPKYLPILKESFASVINDSDGTGKDAKIKGVNLVGKTGTAEIKSSKDDEEGTENGWFVALDIDSSNIVVSMIIEDVKDRGGSNLVVPKVKNSIEYYLKK